MDRRTGASHSAAQRRQYGPVYPHRQDAPGKDVPGALVLSRAMVDKFTARAVRVIAVDMFGFSPSGGAMSGVALAVWFPDKILAKHALTSVLRNRS